MTKSTCEHAGCSRPTLAQFCARHSSPSDRLPSWSVSGGETGTVPTRLGEARKQIRIAAENVDTDTARRLGELDRELAALKRDLAEVEQ